MIRRPTGTKRTVELSKQISALHKGTERIEKFSFAAYKRTKVAEEMVAVQKLQSMIAFFSMPGTDSNKLQKFITNSQERALASLKGGHENLNSKRKVSEHSASPLKHISPASSSSKHAGEVSVHHDGNEEEKVRRKYLVGLLN